MGHLTCQSGSLLYTKSHIKWQEAACCFLVALVREQPSWALGPLGMQVCGPMASQAGRSKWGSRLRGLKHAAHAGLRKPKKSHLCLMGFAAGSQGCLAASSISLSMLCVACGEASSFWPTSMCLLDSGVSSGLQCPLAAAALAAGQSPRQLEVQQLQPGDGSESALVIIQQAFQGHETWKTIVFFFPLCWQHF